MPGRRSPPMPDRLSPQWAISALTRVPLACPAAGMHNKSARLVDDDHRVVFVKNIERDGFARGLCWLRRRNGDTDCIVRTDAVARIEDGPRSDRDIARQHQRLEARARQAGDVTRQHAVKPVAGFFGADNRGFDMGFGAQRGWLIHKKCRAGYVGECAPRFHYFIAFDAMNRYPRGRKFEQTNDFRGAYMTDLTDDEKPLDPAQAKIVAKVRWLMLLSGLATILGIAVVIGVIGVKLFRGGDTTFDVTALIPKGAKIVQTAVAGDYVVVTLDVGGATEIRSFDARTLRQVGRLRFAVEP